MINPELVKNYWLEITTHRLIATPVVILLLYIAVVNSALEEDLVESIENSFYWGAMILACVGGTYYTGSGCMNEFIERTWDQQRLSPLSPWTLTWGKLLGGALFPWYGALICLAGYLLVPALYGAFTPLPVRLMNSFILLELAIFLQGLAILLCLNLANNPDRLLRYRRNHASGALLFALLFMPFLVGLPDIESIVWYDMEIATNQFVILSLLCFASWSVLGAYRLMRQQMQFRNGPLPWIGFLLFIMAYLPGMIRLDGEQLHTRFLMAVNIGLIIFYLLFLTTPIEALRLRRCINAFKMQHWNGLLVNTPIWATTYIITALVAILSSVMLGTDVIVSTEWPEKMSLFVFSMLLFAARDALIWAGLSFGGNAKRVPMITIVYLAILYGLFPFIFLSLEQEWAMAFLWPVFQGEVQVYAVMIELLPLAWWVRRRWLNYGV